MSKAIISCSLLIVREDFVRFVQFLEQSFSVRRFVDIRVMLPREFTVCLFDLVRISVASDAQHFVVIPFT